MGNLDVHIRHGGDGGPAAAAAVIVLLLFIAVGVRAAWPDIVHTVEVIAWTVTGVTGSAIAVTGTVLTTKAVRRRRRARRAVMPPVVQATVIPPARPAVTRPASPPALGQPRQRQAGTWPLPGWWEEIRPRIGGDGDEHRPR
jgi:hypothetical protein